ncbi:MAG TPA: hypothetical protein VMT55_01700 [Candidatus Sulfotelmatobacter sp.]|nr:hypothetical protein [Candidatus Sulfotelmatobacter sp.]
MQNQPEFFRGKDLQLVRSTPRPPRSPIKLWRLIFHYHYRTQRQTCCRTCAFVRYSATAQTWRCRLQNWRRIGPFWVCSKWKKNTKKGVPHA